MKKLALCSLVLMVLFSCSEKSANLDAVEPILNGPWKFSQSKVSAGTPVTIWSPAQTDTMYVDFAPNGVFRSNTFIFSNYTNFSVVDNSTVLLSGINANPIPVKYLFEGPYLRLNPPCYEECSYRFVR